MQVEMNEGDQALLVWCVLQWWLGQSTASHCLGLLVCNWVGLVCQLNWWLLTAWTWYLIPCPSSVLLLMIAAHRTGWPNLGCSLWLLLGQLCHIKPCLPQLVPAMCEGVVVSLLQLQWRSPTFPNNTKAQAGQVLASLLETKLVNVMGCYLMPLDLQGHFGHLVVSGVALSLDIDSRLLIIKVTWSGSHWHENSGHELKLDKFIQLGCKGPCKKIKKLWGLH